MVLRNESINCLLFLKYIECISFYELEKGATELKLLYKIQLENAGQVVKFRKVETTYIASFSQPSGNFKEPNSDWLILNYLDNLLKVEAYFQEKFTNVVAIMINYLFGSVVTKIN